MTFRLIAPADPAALFAALATEPPGRPAILAGGTDLLLDLERGPAAPTTVVSLRRLGWDELRWEGESLFVGATTPLARIEDDPAVRTRIPGFDVAVRAVGGRALRHRATIGGNLGRASPASDLIPVLLALEARVELLGPAGRRELLVDELLVGSRRTVRRPEELIRSVRIPALRSAYLWQRVRPANDISQIGIAAALDRTDRWRLAVGGVSPRPRRLPQAELALHGARPEAASIGEAVRRARAEVTFATDKRASEAYRDQLLGVLLARAVRTVAPGAGS